MKHIIIWNFAYDNVEVYTSGKVETVMSQILNRMFKPDCIQPNGLVISRKRFLEYTILSWASC
jgi:hypothetical protein